MAMDRALRRLSIIPDHVLIDGRQIRNFRFAHRGIIDGDDRCYSIACASIVAKVTRDRLMTSLAARHPVFAWESNRGYATPSHVDGLVRHGPCAHGSASGTVMGSGQLDLAFETRGREALPAPPRP
jgi:ribonuclease HII